MDNSVGELVRSAASKFGEKLALIFEDEQWTFDQLCRLPVNSVHCKLEVTGHTTAQEASDAQEQICREPDRQHAEAG